MLLDVQQRDTQMPNKQTPYAIAKLGESARIIRQSISEMPTLRKQLEKNIEAKSKARNIYGDLQNQRRRLIGALDVAALSLLEAEQDELANHTIKLAQSITSFNLMTPDYTKLCAALNKYLSGLPLPDPNEDGGIFDIAAYNADTGDEPQTLTTNKSIIGRLMNNVRMGYYTPHALITWRILSVA